MNAKNTGSYYTPNKLVKSMVDYIKREDRIKSILEPSAGDGRFIKHLLKHQKYSIDSVELIKEKAKFINDKYINDTVNSINMDFLEYCEKCDAKYDLIIGNPPYINKKLLTEKQKGIGKKLYKEFDLPSATFNNLWVLFILGAIKLLNYKGAIFYVLPLEFLQVGYSKPIRNLLEKRFNCIEIFVFEDTVFKDIQQDVCLVYMSNYVDEVKPYIKCNVIKKLNLNNPSKSNKIMRNKPLEKWSNSIISDEEIELLKKLSDKCLKIDMLGKMSPGVVTGANNYFIIEKKFVKTKRISNYVEPIISKSNYIGNRIILDEDDFEEISNRNHKSYLLKLNNYKYNKLPKGIKEYISVGEKLEINKRYKCNLRSPWYSLPEDRIGDVVFFKRYDTIPRFIINKFKLHTTDIGYNIEVNDNFDSDSIVFCFYNSLSLVLCEFYGRFYAGGVAELIPNEFRQVCIPYKLIKEEDILELDNMFRQNRNYNDIINFVNNTVLKDIATDEEIRMLENMRLRYVNRRKK